MKWKCAGLGLLLFFAQLTVGAVSAKAASIYDNLLGSTDSLSVMCRGAANPEDFSNSWFARFKAASPSDPALAKLQDKFDHNESLGWALKAHRTYSGTPASSYDTLVLYVFNEDASYTLDTYTAGTPNIKAVKFINLDYLYVYHFNTYYGDDASTCGHADTYSYSFTAYENNAVVSSGPGYVLEQTDGEVFIQEVSTQHFLFFGASFIPPADYEGEVLSTQQPAVKYVALGDSFSSGEGNPPFEYGTDQGGTNENRCHRSSKAYPRLLQNDPSLNLGPTAFVGCSGATTDSIRFGHPGTGNWDEGAQVDALSSATELVTLTVGGNDVDFVGYVTACGVSTCGQGTTAYDDMMGRINDPSFKTKLMDTYTDILEAADDANVYVLDYPYMVDPTGTDGIACEPLVDLSAAVPVQMALNGVIEDAVDEVRDLDPDYYGRLIYLPTNHFGSPFIDHHLCTDDPGGSYFNGLNLSNSVYSFHPNANGQQAYYQIMEDYLS